MAFAFILVNVASCFQAFILTSYKREQTVSGNRREVTGIALEGYRAALRHRRNHELGLQSCAAVRHELQKHRARVGRGGRRLSGR